MIKAIKEFFKRFDDKTYAIQYLSEAYDHVDLERRMKELDQRGIRYY